MTQINVCLKDFQSINNNLRICKKSQVCTLHKLIFEKDGDRKNRQRLREFTGFMFKKDDNEYNQKVDYVKKNFSQAELMTIYWLLGLNGDQPDVVTILKNLCAEHFLEDLVEDDDEEDDDEEEDDNEEAEEENGSVIRVINTTMIGNRRQVDPEFEDRAQSSSSRQPVTYENENSYVGNRERRGNVQAQQQRFGLSFRDVEETIKTFDGRNNTTINDWVQEFEETAVLYGWDEMQKLVFAKNSLSGLAKRFVNGEKGLTSWPKLRRALLTEFQRVTNSRHVHQLLTARTMKKDEDVMEYYYVMKEIASSGNVSEKDLILYIIDGIKDITSNKQLLYGAHNLREFKEKLRDYEEYIVARPGNEDRRKQETKPISHNKKPTDFKMNTNRETKCFNCGERGHLAKDCKNKLKGTKCFECNTYGHIARDCLKKKEGQPKEVRSVSTEAKHMIKNVLISNQQCSALIDTGSHVNILNNQKYQQLELPEMSSANIQLTGFGNKVEKLKPLGWVETKVTIDYEDYHLRFYVVPAAYMNEEIIIGLPLYEQAEVVINPAGVTVRKWQSKGAEDEEYSVLNIAVDIEDDVEYSIEETASREAKTAVREMVDNYRPEKTKSTKVVMKIVLTDETPLACRPRRFPITERKAIEEQINTWLEEGIIEESESEFSSPIVMVNKKDGTKRLCVDYRRINKVIVRDRFPLPLIDDQLDRLKDAKVFSTIDLRNGFFHVEVDEGSRKYTSFVSQDGQYQFRKVPFGLSNSPAVFQRFVNAIFRNLTLKGIAMPYIDDIIIPARNEDEAVKNLKQVLELSSDYGLSLNLKKCHFLKRRIEFLGHIIEDQRLMPSPKKVEAVMEYPMPQNRKQVQSFLGLAGYFRKFIPGFSREAKPLSDLLKQDVKFIITEEHHKSFETLKMILCNEPVLKIYNPDHETELHTDASIEGYGAVLLQRLPDDNSLHPVHYMSRKTSEAEQKYTSYELEILAVIEALKKFRIYLLGTRFKVITDCNAFVKTMEKKDLSTRVARWLLLLQEYDFVIEHRSGTSMKHVDALSRCNIIKVMTVNEENVLKKFARAQANDENLSAIIEILNRQENYNGYYQKANVLYKWDNERELLVVPRSLQFDIIRKAHEKGHFATKKTKELLSNEYYIPQLEDKIQQVVSSCLECILLSRKRGRKESLLHPISKPDVPLHTYHVDHLGPLESTSKLYNHIFVVIDAFSKFCWLYPTRSTASKEVIAKLSQQAAIFGNPEVIISDRGTAFTSEEFQLYCKSETIQHHTVTTGLPRANGQVERLNGTVIAVLSKLSVEEPTKWYKWVPRVQQAINSTYQRSIGTDPFSLLVGRPMRTKDELLINELINNEIRAQYNDLREELRNTAKQHLQAIQEENRKTYNLRRRPAPTYRVGDLVAIKRTQFGSGLKLRAKYLGPYEVTRVKANDTYDVKRTGNGEGPLHTSTCAEYMKKWPEADADFGSKF